MQDLDTKSYIQYACYQNLAYSMLANKNEEFAVVKVGVRKRGLSWQYYFEGAKVNGKRKQSPLIEQFYLGQHFRKR